MDTEEPQPDLFVAQDRARRFARYVREVLQERRLTYRGADVGMTSLANEADEALGQVAEDGRRTIADLLARRLRDRERGYMELPLVIATEGIVDRLELARRLDRAASLGGLDVQSARAAVLTLLQDVLLRLEAYGEAYEAKRPAGPLRQTDLVHLLEQVERDTHWSRTLGGRHGEPPPAYDRPPPPILSDPNGLEDLLRAVRAAVGPAAEPWRVEPGGTGRPLTLSLGRAGRAAGALPPPERLARAAEVLAFVHPVVVTCRGVAAETSGGLLSSAPEDAAPTVEAVRLELSDEAAGSLELVLASAAGPEARLGTEAERAVRALMQSPPLPQEGPPPPARLVALLGVLRAMDRLLAERVLPRARTNACRVAASRLPRESTRKAPLSRTLQQALLDSFPGFPAHRLEAVAKDLAAGAVAGGHANAADVAVVLALIGRDGRFGSAVLKRAADLDPLADADIEQVIGDLCEVAEVRRDLERGQEVEAARVTRLEQAAIAVLGRLGRLS